MSVLIGGMTTVALAPAVRLADARVAEIAAAAECVPSGPRHWSGNLDTGDAELSHWVPGQGRTQILAVGTREVTRAEARRRGVGDPDAMPGYTQPAPRRHDETWLTYGVRRDRELAKAREEAITRYLTNEGRDAPWGSPRTEKTLAFGTDGMLTPARDHAVFEVGPAHIRTREDARIYRADIADIDHPTARFLARAKSDIDALLADRQVLLARIAELETAAVPEGGEL